MRLEEIFNDCENIRIALDFILQIPGIYLRLTREQVQIPGNIQTLKTALDGFDDKITTGQLTAFVQEAKLAINTVMQNTRGLLIKDPLIIQATRYGDHDELKAVIELGANLNVPSAMFRASALHVAASKNELDKVELLVIKGADLNALNALGATPLLELINMLEHITQPKLNTMNEQVQQGTLESYADILEFLVKEKNKCSPLDADLEVALDQVNRQLLNQDLNPNYSTFLLRANQALTKNQSMQQTLMQFMHCK